MQVFIKCLSNETVVVNVRDIDTTRELKILIQNVVNIPCTEQRLIYIGNQLQEDTQLLHYGIQNNSTLHLSMRLEGGKHMSQKEFRDSIKPYCFSKWSEKLQKKVEKLLQEYKLDARYYWYADNGTPVHVKLDTYQGLCEAVLTVYTSDEKSSKTKKLFHVQFNRACREVLEFRKDITSFKFATEWYMIDRLFKLKKKFLKHTIYRGIEYSINLREEDTFQFFQFSSFSKMKYKAIEFAGFNGTVFIIIEAVALSVRPYSLFKKEQEYLVHPFTTYIVKSIITKHHLTEVVLYPRSRAKSKK